MSRGFYAGSFDPFTNGHFHVIKRVHELFPELEIVVGVGVNPAKYRSYEQSVMADAIRTILAKENIPATVIIFNGLGVDAAKDTGCNFMIRGIRNDMDYNYEENLAAVNEEVSGIDTIYVRAGLLGNVSSSMVRELLKHGKDVSKYVPAEILEIISK